MTNKDIIKLAMEYGFTGCFDAQGSLTYDATFVEAVTEAVKREREACALICENFADQDTGPDEILIDYHAYLIRQRGEV